MSTITFGPTSTTVSLTVFERIMSFRGDITVPSSYIASIDVVDDGLGHLSVDIGLRGRLLEHAVKGERARGRRTALS